MNSLAWLPTARTPVPEAARIYSAHGLPVFPVAQDKRPLTAHGFADATADENQIRELWSRFPDAGIGWPVALRLLVLDVDARHRGHESLAEMEREHGRLPATLTSVTGGGGLHLVFRLPIGVEARQLAGLRTGIDTRVGGRGYIVVPPSMHASGLRYVWHERVPAAAAPEWLVDLVRRRPAPAPGAYTPRPPVGISKRDRYAAAVLAGEAAEVAATPEGGRNHRLFRAWRRCSADLGDVLDRDIVARELTAAAQAAGLEQREIARVLR
jgi:hypothetical protein